MSPSLSILLVGEGNFSFSAFMSHIHADSRVTATCLQREDEALRHEGAAANVLVIKDSGGSVIFGVDCTKLEECVSLQGHLFDRVVFNFPHCGRKSGVKKNRELLKNFFLSCVQVLAEDGEVHVTLCNGQGGTPADEPRRERHNSWQVVAMAAEAQLVLSDIRPFESGKYQSYKCTGYRSQDKGFHVDKALLHVFTRSLPYVPARILKVEEVVEGDKVQYNVPPELSDYMFRDFLCSGSVHPVRLVQDFLVEGLAENWPVSMTTETTPLLITTARQQTCCHEIDSTQCYWIHPLQKDLGSDVLSPADRDKDQLLSKDTCISAGEVDRVRCKDAESCNIRSACPVVVDPERETGLYLLRPSLLPQMQELLNKKEEVNNKAGSRRDTESDSDGVTTVFHGLSGLVFRSVSVHVWAQPAFHQLLLTGVFSVDCEPITFLRQRLDTLLASYGVSVVTVQGGLRLTAQPMGLVGKVFLNHKSEDSISLTVSLNLDLLAVLLFSLPDWRLLWSHDQRFLKQFGPRPSPGTAFRPFSLFPEHFSFDISFWTGPSWEERRFHALVREAGHGTVEQLKLIDTFSHPDLSQTSYCYRLLYHTHTHALSHTHALLFHKHLESLLSSRLQVTLR
ncbi:ferredoxin-fold anticodon-binding domain-containing protein 1 [Solea senegalensis]|uniref:Ferredoxin-fold anticodon-binding domain-containing protein 1 n=2 Tax=Solea senegalensis TaxID=28829 RepID=A0AAV6SG40_SOLSE|nr:ferredoxin-fold anticodon-binding domain-containing protein 1 [Solea senegalensis]KAG7516110.1 ferredoxin-fold anticodon-binding domain-containing protein 1 [Solea senegalensis]